MKLRISILVLVCLWLGGCGKDSATIGSGVDATMSVLSYLNLAGALIPKPATREANPASNNRAAFGTTWNTLGALSMGHPKNDGTLSCTYTGNVTLKDWMGYQFDKDAVRCNTSSINIFGRVKTSLAIFCALSYVVGASSTSAAIPAGTRTVTFDAATKAGMLAACGISPGEVADGTTATLVISHPSGNYDTQFALTMGSESQTMFMTYATTVAKIATNETNSNGGQRVLVDLNTATGLLRAEYVSRNTSGGVYIHRLYQDSTADMARVMSQEGGSTGEYRRYVVTGKPASTSAVDVGLSVDIKGNITTPTFNGDFDREACVNKTSGALSTDGPTVTTGSFTCGAVTGRTVDVSTGFGLTETATGVSNWQALTVSTVLSWTTIEDMLTSSL